jgi:hypothetical protein
MGIGLRELRHIAMLDQLDTAAPLILPFPPLREAIDSKT